MEIVLVIEGTMEHFRDLQSYIQEKGMSNVRLLFPSNSQGGLSAARNLGARESRGGIIAFVDDDVLVSARWAEELAGTFQDDSVVGVTGPALPLWESRSMDWLPEELMWLFGSTVWYSAKGKSDTRHAWGMNMAFRREAFDLCGGFSTAHGLIGGRLVGSQEDVEFSLRMKRRSGKRILYNPSMIVYHKVDASRLRWSFIFERAYSMGHAKRRISIWLPSETGVASLSREYNLLRRIVTHLVPNILGEFPKNPARAWRRFFATVLVLLLATVGYLTPVLVYDTVLAKISRGR